MRRYDVSRWYKRQYCFLWIRFTQHTPPSDLQHAYGYHKGTNYAKVKRRRKIPQF